MTEETSKIKDDKMKEAAKPYHDINTPFSIDENGAIAEYVINDPETMPQLALGATIVIRDLRKDDNDASSDKYEEFWYSGRIIGLKAVSPFSPERTSMLYREDETTDPTKPLEKVNGPHTHQPMVIKAALTQEWSLTKNKKSHDSSAVQRPPSGHSLLFFPDLRTEESERAPSLERILGVRDNGLELGKIGFGNRPYGWKKKEFITYRWDINDLDNKHMFIVGESGSGKTVFLKNLAYEIRKSKTLDGETNRVLLTDVQGDIAQLLFWDWVDTVPISGWRPEISKEQYEEARKVFGEFRLIVPMTKDEQAKTEIQRVMNLASKADGVEIDTVSLRFQDLRSPRDVEYLFRTSSDQVAPLLEELAEGIEANKEPASIARLQTAISRLLSRNSGNQIILPTTGVSYYRSTFQAAQRVLSDMLEYFDMDSDALQQTENPLNAFKHDGTSVLYLDHLNQDERFMWEMQLVNWLYRNKKDMENTYIFLDEAHQIIPKEKETGSSITKGVLYRLRSNFEKLAREGRKFRLNLILSTQNPQDIHPIVQEQCPTRVVMKINVKNAGHAGLESGLAYIANSFNHGQFWIQSPFNGTPDWVRVHSIAPPVPHEPMNTYRKKLKEKAENN